MYARETAYRLFCSNPQSLRALMTARHDPLGKILGDHGAGNIKYAARVESTVMSRRCERERAGSRPPENAPVYGARFVKRHDTVRMLFY